METMKKVVMSCEEELELTIEGCYFSAAVIKHGDRAPWEGMAYLEPEG